MSNNFTVAKLIPAEFRKQLLNDNVIYKAVVAANDTHMHILVIIYRNYIFTEGEPVDMNNPCLACLAKILQIFQTIQSDLETLEKQSQLLGAI